MPFPILRTPFVVLSEIISLLQPNEIVTASFCSKKVKRLLKGHYQQRKPLEWKLIMTDYFSRTHVDILTSEDDEQITVIAAEDFSELNKSIPLPRKSNRCVVTYWEKYPVIYSKDRVRAAEKIVDRVSDLFNLDVHVLAIDTNGIWAIDCINNRQKKMLGRFAWYGDEGMDHVLRNARASKFCIGEGNVSDNYRFDGKLGPANRLSIDPNGHWVTLDNLMNFDFVSVVVGRCRITVSDVYTFIGHWLSGGSPRLTFLRLVFDNQLDFENFEDQLEVVERDISGEYRLSDGDTWPFDHGYSIQRNDGVKAVIDFRTDHFVMMVCLGENVYDRINYAKGNSDQQFLLHQNVILATGQAGPGRVGP
ncbi:unnamed protein product [Caenorhabditis nigoni]